MGIASLAQAGAACQGEGRESLGKVMRCCVFKVDDVCTCVQHACSGQGTVTQNPGALCSSNAQALFCTTFLLRGLT
eukprot:1161023-Pelagomonas_calceolata.AAC.9